ncbi:MAG: S41 family peptidase, partial [Bacteroidota bacterium]
GGTIFPLEIALENGKALIRKNWSDQESILPGMQLLSIDGVEIDEVLAEIYSQIPAERLYFKQAKLEMFSFPRYAWQIFGEQETFQIKILAQGITKPYTIKAVPLIEEFEMKRDEILNAQQRIEFLPEAAYLNPGDFGGDEPKYQAFIDSAFTEIKNQKPKNLIIDLRNNRGGNDSYSDYMVAYIADKPFRWNERFTLKTSAFLKTFVRENYDTTDVFWREVLDRQDGEIYDYDFEPVNPMPKNKRFQGEVFVLINRHSYSQSAVTAAQIQDYGWGTIVGEETGEFPTLYASQFQYPLPNTGIIVKVSKGQIVRVNGSTKAEGVIPDIEIRDHLVDEKDEILEGLLERLR